MLFLTVDTITDRLKIRVKVEFWVEWRKGLGCVLSFCPLVTSLQCPPCPLYSDTASWPAPGPRSAHMATWRAFLGSQGPNNQFRNYRFGVFLRLFNDSWFYPDWDNFLFVPLIHAFHLIKQFIFIWCLTNKIFVSVPVKLRRPRSNPDLKIIEDTGFLRMEAGVLCNYCSR